MAPTEGRVAKPERRWGCRHGTLNIRRWIFWKPLEMEVWFQRTTDRKWPRENQMVTWPMTSRDPERSNSWPQRIGNAISRKQLEMLFSNNLYC